MCRTQELLQEAEADETEESRWTVTSAGGGGSGGSTRYMPGSNRSRRHKRDSVSEHLTHGGSLQNLAREPGPNSEFDSGFAYLTSGLGAHGLREAGSAGYGGGPGASGRRSGGGAKSKRHAGSSNVSARQREGGSLPSNVNATNTPLSADLIFEEKVHTHPHTPTHTHTHREREREIHPYRHTERERYIHTHTHTIHTHTHICTHLHTLLSFLVYLSLFLYPPLL